MSVKASGLVTMALLMLLCAPSIAREQHLPPADETRETMFKECGTDDASSGSETQAQGQRVRNYSWICPNGCSWSSCGHSACGEKWHCVTPAPDAQNAGGNSGPSPNPPAVNSASASPDVSSEAEDQVWLPEAGGQTRDRHQYLEEALAWRTMLDLEAMAAANPPDVVIDPSAAEHPSGPPHDLDEWAYNTTLEDSNQAAGCDADPLLDQSEELMDIVFSYHWAATDHQNVLLNFGEDRIRFHDTDLPLMEALRSAEYLGLDDEGVRLRSRVLSKREAGNGSEPIPVRFPDFPFSEQLTPEALAEIPTTYDFHVPQSTYLRSLMDGGKVVVVENPPGRALGAEGRTHLETLAENNQLGLLYPRPVPAGGTIQNADRQNEHSGLARSLLESEPTDMFVMALSSPTLLRVGMAIGRQVEGENSSPAFDPPGGSAIADTGSGSGGIRRPLPPPVAAAHRHAAASLAPSVISFLNLLVQELTKPPHHFVVVGSEADGKPFHTVLTNVKQANGTYALRVLDHESARVFLAGERSR